MTVAVFTFVLEVRIMGDVVPISEKRYVLTVTQTASEMKAQLAILQDVCKHHLTNKVDYGLIPGTGNKPALFKPGAEKLCDIFGLAVDPVIESRTEDWETGLFDYVVKAYVKTRDGKLTLSSAMGSCSSWESKYRYVNAKRTCPACEQEGTIRKSKFPDKKTGDIGWWCSNEACKTNFASDDKSITGQELGKKEREDFADIKNTILKMAEKRAVVAAVIRACRAAEIFTQDMEDLSGCLPEEYLDVEWKDISGESKEEPAESGKPKEPAKSTGKPAPASAKDAGGSSPSNQAPATGAGQQTTPKSPAKSAQKPQESQASAVNAPPASGAPTGNADEEFVALKGGIWKAYLASQYAIQVTNAEEKQRNTAIFKTILVEQFGIDADNAEEFRRALTADKAQQISFYFIQKPKEA